MSRTPRESTGNNASELKDRREYWKKSVQREFRYRRKELRRHDGHRVHHFNWDGAAVDGPSNTDPEVSLFVIISGPRVVKPGSSRDVWMSVVMDCALRYVDPVLIMLRNGADIPRYPQGLIRYAKGRTFKFYSPHGSWSANTLGRIGIIQDDGNADFYNDPDVAIGNGFIEGTGIEWRGKWYANKDALQVMAHKRRRRHVLPQRIEDLHPSPGPSRLRHCISADEV